MAPTTGFLSRRPNNPYEVAIIKIKKNTTRMSAKMTTVVVFYPKTHKTRQKVNKLEHFEHK